MELEKLQKIIAGILNVDPSEVAMDSTLRDDLGADSLDCYQIFTKIEEVFHIHLTTEEIENCVRIEDVIDAIKKAMK